MRHFTPNKACLLVAFWLFGHVICAQDTLRVDSLSKPKIHSPLRASLYSTVIPGLGQIYNKKYWKLPIIWGGIGTAIYFAQYNRTDYRFFKQGYVNRELGLPEDPELAQYSTTGIKTAMETARQNMEWCYIGALAVYLLNIVDASVDAHLFTFDVSDDLSLKITPTVVSPNTMALGVKLSVSAR